MTELLWHFGDQLLGICAIAVGSCLAALLVHRSTGWPLNLPWACLAGGSALAIAVVTLTRQGGAVTPGTLQLTPLHTIRGYLALGGGDLAFYLLGNVALFPPFGFCAYLALRRGVLVAAGASVLGSAGVEILQLPIWSRSTDVDDVLLNGLGGLLGALLAALALVVWHRATDPTSDATDVPNARHLLDTRA